MKTSGQIILAIESAICGGSISLLRDGKEVANWIGSSNVSKAEDLLYNIDSILAANEFSRDVIDLIAVSAGPGSFTGIRIGLATALGIKAGLGIAMSSESALKAMVFAQPSFQRVIAALPVGRNTVCLQEFQRSEREVTAINEPHAIAETEFQKFVRSEKDTIFLLHAALHEKVKPSPLITNFGSNLAFAVGKICCENIGVVTKPLFISKAS